MPPTGRTPRTPAATKTPATPKNAAAPGALLRPDCGWAFWVGGMAVALLNTALLAYRGRPWGITSSVTGWALSGLAGLGVDVASWPWWQAREQAHAALPAADPWSHLPWFAQDTVLNLGVIAGACLAAILTSQWRFRRVRSLKVAASAVIGGFLMGYGARVALGCNIGALVGGISSLSAQGWVYAIFLAAGAFAGSFLVKRLWLS